MGILVAEEAVRNVEPIRHRNGRFRRLLERKIDGVESAASRGATFYSSLPSAAAEEHHGSA